MRIISYVFLFVLGFFIAKFIYDKPLSTNTKHESRVIVQGIQNLSKLVVSKGNFAEIYTFSDSKKYVFDVFSFDKKAIVSVNAKVEVGYDLSKMKIEVDSIRKQIIINKIPSQELNITPDLKYFDLKESAFNSFSTDELNQIHQKAIQEIEKTTQIIALKQQAKERLFIELSKIFQLSKVYGWKVVNQTDTDLLKLKL